MTVAAAAGAATYTFQINGVTTQVSSTENLFLTVSSTTDTTTLEVSNGDTISVIVTDSNGCTIDSTLTIVGSGSGPQTGAIIGSDNVISLDIKQYLVSQTFGSSYFWSVINGAPTPSINLGCSRPTCV